MELRNQALYIWQLNNPLEKYHQLQNLKTIIFNKSNINTQHIFDDIYTLGQPKLLNVPHNQVPKRSFHTLEGKCAMLHALTHIEFNAINLALDAIWRFVNMPISYYLDWLKVAIEEALHFYLLNSYLEEFNYQYGYFAVHNGLWDMAEKTKNNLLARLAMVPRTLEARGLDMAPVIYAKLQEISDIKGANILHTILTDELEHVLIGNKWYEYLCHKNNLEPIQTYQKLCQEYNSPSPSKPINQLARRNAGFYPIEIKELCNKLNIDYIH